VATEWKAGCSAAAASSFSSASMAPGSVSTSTPGTRSAKTRTPCTAPTVRPVSWTSAVSWSAENRRGTGSPSPQRPAGSVRAWRASLKWPARARARTAPPQARGEQAEGAGRTQGLDGVAHALGGVVDVLQDAVAEHGVVAAALDDVEQAVGVALDGAHAVGDAGLGSPALQGEEGVGAGVDDGDAVAEAGHGHGEVAGAAAGVEDVQGVAPGGLDPAVQGVLEDLPDHGGTKGCARAQRVRHGGWLLGGGMNV
jgi:hypothetical protein